MKEFTRMTVSLVLALAGCHASSAPHPTGGSLPVLKNVVSEVHGDRLRITFDPVVGAKDYRVYPQPDASHAQPDGSLKNVIYRCAGDREATLVPLDDGPAASTWYKTYVNHSVEGYSRTQAEATLGYVYTAPAADRTAVYALGNPAERGDNQCVETYPSLWQSSRVKTYTTSAATRATLLAQGWRDDGVAFYTATAATVQVWTAHLNNDFLYYASATEVSARSGNSPTPAFFILSTAPDTEAVPLMRVNYSGLCSWSHDELVAGEPMFERISTQGNQPIFEVEWSGLTGPTTLVVEALDQGCPFQGHLSASHVPATGLAHDFVSIADAQAASPTGEVFVNGQHDPASKPHAMAQSTVRVAPSTPEAMDFFDGFSGAGETFSQTKLVDFGAWNLFLGSPTYDVQFYELEAKAYSIGAVMGELWVSYADAGSDTNGKLRITPRTKGTLSATSFLHVTMETDLVSTGRRYPQILVSDQPSPVQDNLPNGTTFILQTFRSWPNVLQMEVCDHRTWDVNHQCPHFTLDTNQPGDGLPWSPHQPVGEHAGVAHLGRLDLYLSTRTAYALLDGQPYGCAQLSVAPAAGPVTVTFGDTLYHSGVDEAIVPTPSPYQFHKSYMLTQTRRQFDNLGFSSGVPAPAWDSTRFPCVSTTMP